MKISQKTIKEEDVKTIEGILEMINILMKYLNSNEFLNDHNTFLIDTEKS